MTTFADDLREFAADAWHLYQSHPWFVALADGSLSRKRFRFWLEQDLPYVADYAFARRACVEKLRDAPPFADVRHLASTAEWQQFPGEEEAAFELEMLAAIGVEAPPASRFTARPAREAYMNHIVRVAHEGSVGEIVAALLPCEWGFTEMAATLDGRRAPDLDPLYARLLDYYSAEEQIRNTQASLALVERAAEIATVEERSTMRLIFLRSVQHQVDVLDTAWRTEDLWPDERTALVAQR